MIRNLIHVASFARIAGLLSFVLFLANAESAFGWKPYFRSTSPGHDSHRLGGCVDDDGDGYGNPGDASCDNGAQEDCRDDDAAINPGAAEVCGDSVDNDCDGDIDFGLFENYYPIPPGQPPQSTGTCYVSDPPGCEWTGDPPVPPPGGCCRTPGHKVCNAALNGVECELDEGNIVRLLEVEGPVGEGTCFDGFDNDCDAMTDHADPDCQGPEVCNQFDDDFDGLIDEDFDLGQPCTVGVGACERTGVAVCDGPNAAKCSKSPFPAELEATPGTGKCIDGKDNDCDGLTDLADPGCQAAELCDDADNDGDGDIDEDFANLGDICTTGQGVCQSNGFFVCKADGSGTVCNASLNLAASSPEGPAGLTCTDGVDNDCDGVVDAADPGCGSSEIGATCALQLLQQAPNGASCEGHYRIKFETFGAGTDAQVIAELLALDQQGQAQGVLAVQQNEVAHLKSRLNPNAWAFYSKPNTRRGGPLAGPGNFHTVFAPVPLLRVRVKDALNEAVAYCSPVPYLEVVKPSNTVVDATQNGGTTDVLAALPLVIPGSLKVLVNGVDIFAAMGINPATTFPGTHPGGAVFIGGTLVAISDIVVDIASSIGVLSSNTLRLKLDGLACGGNDIVVDADGAFPAGTNLPVTPQCHVDDMHDCGASLVFDLQIHTPLEGEITSAVPTPVTGEVCHGLEITQTSINGKQLNPEGQNNFTAGTGECAGGTYKFTIDTTLEQTPSPVWSLKGKRL